jgi:hypothetical protein
MREDIERLGLTGENTPQTMKRIEDYLWIGERPKPIWTFVTLPDLVTDEDGLDAQRDANYQYGLLKSEGNVVGDCSTEMALVDAFAKALGIPTIPSWATRMEAPVHCHAWNLYYDHQRHQYAAYPRHFEEISQFGDSDALYDWFVYLPPASSSGYLYNRIDEWQDGGEWIARYYGNYSFVWRDIRCEDMVDMAINGISQPEMKSILLH